ncbi:hypothetical protein [Paraburkholderia sp. SIMBA_054]|uniref:hypothetical protein n=1 Tax=Paraburkholderia sp. SIMBA_054 TaxID=3085795 RepID=UPI00397C5697
MGIDGHVDAVLKVNLDAFSSVASYVIDGMARMLGPCGMMGVDLEDMRTAITGGKRLLVGLGDGSGERGAAEAAQRALKSLAAPQASLTYATGMFVIMGGEALKLSETRSILDIIRTQAGAATHVYAGAYRDSRLDNSTRVALLCTFQ